MRRWMIGACLTMVALAGWTSDAKAVNPPRFGFSQPGSSYQVPWYAYASATSGSMWGRAQERNEIRSTPIVDRPYRFGHVYGNTVRRMNGR